MRALTQTDRVAAFIVTFQYFRRLDTNKNSALRDANAALFNCRHGYQAITTSTISGDRRNDGFIVGVQNYSITLRQFCVYTVATMYDSF